MVYKTPITKSGAQRRSHNQLKFMQMWVMKILMKIFKPLKNYREKMINISLINFCNLNDRKVAFKKIKKKKKLLL